MAIGNRRADFDVSLSNSQSSPRGIWSNLSHFWVAGASKFFGYDYNTRAYDTAQDFNYNLGSQPNIAGVWGDGTTIYALSARSNVIYAWNIATKRRDSAKDINVLTGSRGIWSDGTIIYVANGGAVFTGGDEKILAYNIASKRRDSAKEIDLIHDSGLAFTVNGIWSDGTTIWAYVNFLGQATTQIVAYNLADGTQIGSGTEVPGLNGNIWSDGTILWGTATGALRAYDLRAAPNPPRNLSLNIVRRNNIIATWDAPDTSDGSPPAVSYEMRFNFTGFTQNYGRVAGVQTLFGQIPGRSPGGYDVQVRSVSATGSTSAWTPIETIVVAAPPPRPDPMLPLPPGTPPVLTPPETRIAFFGFPHDLTDRVHSIEWWVGAPQTVAFGSVYMGARLEALLYNEDGLLDPYENNGLIDTSPGAQVQIAMPVGDDNIRQFTGFSDGIEAVALPTGKFARMSALAPLDWLEAYNDDIFIRLSGTLRTDEVLAALLDDAGWPTDARLLDQGLVSVFAHEIKKLGVLSQGRSRASLISSAKILALLETGRIVADRLGRIRFENHNNRPTQAALAGAAPINLTPGTIMIDGSSAGFAGSRGIVNSIESENDPYETAGENVAIRVHGGLPQTVQIPDGGGGIKFYITEEQPGRIGQAFVQNWNQPTFTFSGSGDIRISAGENFIQLYSDTSGTLTVTALTGNTFQRKASAPLNVVRNASITKYGRRPVVIPGEAVSNIVQYRQSLNQLIDIHDALDGDGEPNPVKYSTVNVRIGEDATSRQILRFGDVSQWAILHEPRIGINTPTRFLIDAIHHRFTDRKVHTATLYLVEARAFEAI